MFAFLLTTNSIQVIDQEIKKKRMKREAEMQGRLGAWNWWVLLALNTVTGALMYSFEKYVETILKWFSAFLNLLYVID